MQLNDFLKLSSHELNSLRILDLSGNNFRNLNISSFQTLKNALSQCHGLEIINLSYNYFNWKYFDNNLSISSFQAFGDSIPQSCGLQKIYLDLNDFGTLKIEYLQILSDIFSRCYSLHTLSLSNNELGFLDETSFQFLCNTISKSSSLQNLDLTENYFDKTQSQQLYKVVEDHNRQANLNKMATNAVLFYWDGLKSQKYKATTIFTVGSLPEDVIMEILRCLGYIHCTLSSNNKVKFVRKLLNLKI